MTGEQVRVFTPTQLRTLRGENNSRICLSIKGVVYDVSQSRHLYGPGNSTLIPLMLTS